MADAPDIYADNLVLSINPFGVIVVLQIIDPLAPTGSPSQSTTVGTVRLSPQLAKFLALALRRDMKKYEREHGDVVLSPVIWNGLGVSREDW